MPTPIPSIAWQPYQGGGAGTLVAVVNLDSTVDQSWTVPIVAPWQNNASVVADVVVVFNTQNNGAVQIFVGPIEVDIQPLSRDYVQLSGSNQPNIGVIFSVGSIQLQFYKGSPPYNPSVINYAAAQALANANVFPGGTTMGTSNAQTASVNNTYSFVNGILLILTAGFTNTGALTLAVNGGGLVPVTKNGLALSGGEITIGQNFIVTPNTTSGEFNLVSGIPPLLCRGYAVFDATPTILNSYNVSSVVKVGNGTFIVNWTVPMSHATYPAVVNGNGGPGVFFFGTPINAASYNVESANTVTQTNQDAAGGYSVIVFDTQP